MTHSDKPVLSIENLTVRLPDGADRRNAVSNVTLTVNPGEIVCVVGESGSGKSVSSHAVMGLLPKELQVATGRILVNGENVVEKSPKELRAMRGTEMAMIFQEPMTALNPVIKVGEQIDEVLRIHTKLSAKERYDRVIDIMTAVNLPDPVSMASAYPHQLSGGQRQRIMIASALVLNPKVLIADEPTTALDVTTQAQILKLIYEIQKSRGMGVLFITHDFGVVAEIAHRVVVMRRGEVVETGTADEVLNRPQHEYTKMLMAAVPGTVPPYRPSKAANKIGFETVKLEKTYGGQSVFKKDRVVHALKGVDLRVRKGETLGIVGESGSGKSTFARCVVRLIDPTAGAVLIGTEDIARMSQRQLKPNRKRIQIVFQDPYRSLNPRVSVGQSIIEGPMNFGVSETAALAKARDLMALVGLSPDALDRLPHQFSGGQRQRICIARALAMEPEILIADESVSALDVSIQKQVLELLDRVREEFNLAVLFITHDLRVAAQVCDRIAVMHRGEVVELGETAAMFANPTHEYTRALFDAAPGKNHRFGQVAAV
ncbi:ABC transporter ATP-binding protein [Rhizobium oryziradicis]|uniref:Microcin ABC transporter ATP-binding protein n=1 Tax=Rhizobium oryziradicis TaxID=1867956 RepID=A0A1Q8ZK95_9HYPH|nr:ABC transporter ATP-binding protein [Rhizobium oryziradicis]OLP42314.1 microcin ABC transporter ATP-binding protein [Rhizobium oryziradicis]